MIKKITYNNIEYDLEIKWSGSTYCFRVVGFTGFVSIPMEHLKDIEILKVIIANTITKDNDLDAILKWDGVITTTQEQKQNDLKSDYKNDLSLSYKAGMETSSGFQIVNPDEYFEDWYLNNKESLKLIKHI